MTEGDRRLHETLTECEISINFIFVSFPLDNNNCVMFVYVYTLFHMIYLKLQYLTEYFIFALHKSIYFYDYVFFFVALFKVTSVKIL